MTLTRPSRLNPAAAVPRDGRNRPLVVPMAGGKPKAHTRVTTHIACLEDESALHRFDKRMTIYGAARRPSILAGAASADPDSPEGKALLERIVATADRLSDKDAKANRGTRLHSYTEDADLGRSLPSNISAVDRADIAAYLLATTAFEVMETELFCVVPELGAAGTMDRVGVFDGVTPDGKDAGIVVADIKSGRLDYGHLKREAQLAVYSRGKRYNHAKFPVNVNDPVAFAAWKKRAFSAAEAQAAYGELQVNQTWGLVIHLPAGQANCSLHWADLRRGWANAQLGLQIRMARSAAKAHVPAIPKSKCE